MLRLRWFFSCQRGYCSMQPPTGEWLAFAALVDLLLRKLTLGRYGWSGLNITPTKCAVCGRTMWVSRPRRICLEWKCYEADRRKHESPSRV